MLQAKSSPDVKIFKGAVYIFFWGSTGIGNFAADGGEHVQSLPAL